MADGFLGDVTPGKNLLVFIFGQYIFIYKIFVCLFQMVQLFISNAREIVRDGEQIENQRRDFRVHGAGFQCFPFHVLWSE